LAGITLRPWAVGVVLALSIISSFLLGVLVPAATQAPLTVDEVIVFGVLLAGFATVLSILGAYNAERALLMVRQSRIIAEQSSEALRLALAEQASQSASLQQALSAQQQLNAVVDALSLPIIQVRDGVLVVPLVGNLSGERIRQLQFALL